MLVIRTLNFQEEALTPPIFPRQNLSLLFLFDLLCTTENFNVRTKDHKSQLTNFTLKLKQKVNI